MIITKLRGPIDLDEEDERAFEDNINTQELELFFSSKERSEMLEMLPPGPPRIAFTRDWIRKERDEPPAQMSLLKEW